MDSKYTASGEVACTIGGCEMENGSREAAVGVHVTMGEMLARSEELEVRLPDIKVAFPCQLDHNALHMVTQMGMPVPNFVTRTFLNPDEARELLDGGSIPLNVREEFETKVTDAESARTKILTMLVEAGKKAEQALSGVDPLASMWGAQAFGYNDAEA